MKLQSEYGASYSKETRAIFDEDIYWATSRTATDEVLRKIKNTGFNVYVPCVWHGRGARYVSALVPVDPRLTNVVSSEYDPLRYLINRAHYLDIEVHPWFAITLREGKLFPEFHAEGLPINAFNVHNGEFRGFIINLVEEVARKYDVDGINIDYIRSRGVCLSRACKNSYKNMFHRSLYADYLLRKTSSDAFDRLSHWNKTGVDKILVGINEAVTTINPNIILSVDSVPGARHLKMEGQNAIEWANNGLIDVIFFMYYKERIDFEEIANAIDDLKDKKIIYLLLSTYNTKLRKVIVHKEPEVLVRDVRKIRSESIYLGEGFYHYKQLADDQAGALRKNVYQEDVNAIWPKTSQQR
jgi:uncharacterized lipoprotein YddW (UPF0748 family)